MLNKDAHRVVRQRKCAISLTEIGRESYSTLNNQLVPMQERETPFPGIVKALEVHDPAPLEIIESFYFGTRH